MFRQTLAYIKELSLMHESALSHHMGLMHESALSQHMRLIHESALSHHMRLIHKILNNYISCEDICVIDGQCNYHIAHDIDIERELFWGFFFLDRK